MSIRTILFDLDGTLLPMDQDAFIHAYTHRLAAYMAPYGYDPQLLIKALWTGTGAMVKNNGAATKDALQLYIKNEDSAFAPLNPVLCGLAKVELAAGEEKTVELTVPAAAFTVVNDEGERVPDGKNFTLYGGTGQPDARTAALTGKTCVSVKIEL